MLCLHNYDTLLRNIQSLAQDSIKLCEKNSKNIFSGVHCHFIQLSLCSQEKRQILIRKNFVKAFWFWL